MVFQNSILYIILKKNNSKINFVNTSPLICFRWIFQTMAVNNNIMVRLLVIEITFLILAVVNSYPAFEDNEFKHKNRDKGRSIRGFKNMDLSTARGFGKRTDHYVNLMPSDLFVDNKEDSFNQK